MFRLFERYRENFVCFRLFLKIVIHTSLNNFYPKAVTFITSWNLMVPTRYWIDSNCCVKLWYWIIMFCVYTIFLIWMKISQKIAIIVVWNFTNGNECLWADDKNRILHVCWKNQSSGGFSISLLIKKIRQNVVVPHNWISALSNFQFLSQILSNSECFVSSDENCVNWFPFASDR